MVCPVLRRACDQHMAVLLPAACPGSVFHVEFTAGITQAVCMIGSVLLLGVLMPMPTRPYAYVDKAVPLYLCSSFVQ